MIRGFLHSVLVGFLLLVAICTSAQETEVKVMTFNVRLDRARDKSNSWKFRKENVGNMLKYYEPDIIGMQEVLHNQLVDLKELLPHYTALGVGRTDGKQKGEHCPVFFKTERFELLDYGNFGLSENPDSIGLKGWDSKYERIVTWVLLKDKKSDKRVAFFNTHLDHAGKVARRKSARLIADKARHLCQNAPIVITGDFNATPDSEVIEIITKENRLRDARVASPVTNASLWTFHDFGKLPPKRRELIDYIFTDNNIEVLYHRIIKDKPDNGHLSDHCPVIAILKLK